MDANKYILIGIPNCGKSTLGRRAADALGWPFYDTDLMACEKLGIRNALDQFRAAFNGSIMTAQRAAVIELAGLNSAAVIATGAEVALMPGCATQLRRMGAIIHIRREQEHILSNMANDGEPRLVLRNNTDGTEVVMREEAVKLYARELSQYEVLADWTLDNNESEDAGLEKLIALINDLEIKSTQP